ncbi:MAG TPA: pitrilysin family protein, partial [Thermoplasmata archaeon]
LSIPLDIESDRMTRATIAPEEVERERTVIRSEREGTENWPEFRVEEQLHALAFQRHPYRWDPLGYPEDILALTPKDLSEYYRRFYGTRNATLIVSGGFSSDLVRTEVRRRFSRLPASGEDPRVRVIEPPQRGDRTMTLSGPGTTPFLEAAWKAPSVADPLAAGTILLDVILGGETRLFTPGSAWGRSPEHPSARLYRRLVDTGLAVRAQSGWRPRVHPGLFGVHAQAASGVSLARLEAAVLDEVERLRRRGPTKAELHEAQTKVASGAALAYEGASRRGFRLGYFEMLGPKGFESRLLRQVLSAGLETVRASAAAILTPDNRTVVRYEPTEDSVAA